MARGRGEGEATQASRSCCETLELGVVGFESSSYDSLKLAALDSVKREGGGDVKGGSTAHVRQR